MPLRNLLCHPHVPRPTRRVRPLEHRLLTASTPTQRGLTGLAAEDDKASNPVAISLLGTDAEVLEADALADPYRAAKQAEPPNPTPEL
jgi:hypothetical protein